MDQTPDPAAPEEGARSQERRHDVEVRVRRAPKYGVFMAIGAVVGAVVAWLIGELQPPAVNEAGQRLDTTPVIGLIVVVGFVLGAAAGGIAALIADRAMAKRGRTLTAERRDVEAPREQPAAPLASGLPMDAGEADVERLGTQPRDVPQRGELGSEHPDPSGEAPDERERPDRA